MEYTLRELEEWNVKIEKKATEFGLDYYPQEFEIIGFNEMIAYESYVGMPSKYPHWSYGKAYEKNNFVFIDDGLTEEFLMEFVSDKNDIEKIKPIIYKKLMNDWVSLGEEADHHYLT